MSVLPLPKHFDQNEWFMIITLVLTNFIVFLLRKKFSKSKIILIVLFSATLARFVDHLGATPVIDLYDISDTGKFEFFDIVSYFLYPPFAVLMIYFYKKMDIAGIKTLWYLLVWSVLAVAYEWVAVIFDVYKFKTWEHVYSLPVYLLSQYITILFYRFIKEKYKKS